MPNLTYTLDELLATRFTNKYITQFDFSGLAGVMNSELAVWNGQMNEMLSLFCDVSNKQMMNTGSSDVGSDFVPLDGEGKAPSSGALPGNTLAWPLRRFGRGISVTRLWAEQATPYDLLMKQNEIQIKAKQRVMAEIAKGIFYNANYTFGDRFYDNLDLPVKAFYNADATWKIPNGPTGTVFTPSTHNHYVGTANLANSDISTKLIDNVAEHGGRGLQIHISLTDKAALTALSGFKALDYGGFDQYASTKDVLSEKLDPNADPNDQFIGRWTDNGMVPVFVKPWAKAGYITCVATQSDSKPLMYRIHPNANYSGLRLWSKTSDGSIMNDQYEMFMGFAPLNRAGMAILDIANAIYVSPVTAAQLEA
jgi:hypothetical protein